MANKTNEARIAALEAEIASLRSPVPREEPLHRTLPGQSGLFDRNGNPVQQLAEVAPASTTVGGGSFGVYRTDPDTGERVYAPDGVRRTREGEVVIRGAPDPAAAMSGPVRTHAHQRHVEMIDRLFPVIPAPLPDPPDPEA